MDINGSVILITGSAERVGKSIALALARQGGRVVIQYHTKKEAAEATADELAAYGDRPLIVQGDIGKAKSWKAMRDAVLAHHGHIDVLINNAAIFYRTPFLEATEEQWDHFMDVNLKSVFLGCRLIGEVMYKQQRGKIINIADVSAQNVWPTYIPYCVSKAGVVAITRGLAKALAPHVTVNSVSPGTVLLADEYDEAEEQSLIDKTPLKRVGRPEDIANSVAFLISGSDFITGIEIRVDGGRSLA